MADGMSIEKAFGIDAKGLENLTHTKRPTQIDLGDPRLNRKFGFRAPGVYDKKFESEYYIYLKQGSHTISDFMKLARDLDSKDHVFGEVKTRRLWAATFMNNSLEECAEALALLRRQVEIGLKIGGQRFLQKEVDAKWIFQQPTEDMNEWCCQRDSALAGFSRGQTVVAVNMTGGLPYAPLILESMKKLDREPAGYALIGFSNQGQTAFEDGNPMQREFFVHPRELRTLYDNRDKVALVIDDSHRHGEALTQVVKYMKSMGFKRVYKVVGSDLRLVDGDDYWR